MPEITQQIRTQLVFAFKVFGPRTCVTLTLLFSAAPSFNTRPFKTVQGGITQRFEAQQVWHVLWTEASQPVKTEAMGGYGHNLAPLSKSSKAGRRYKALSGPKTRRWSTRLSSFPEELIVYKSHCHSHRNRVSPALSL